MKTLNNIINFFGCLLSGKCKYSIKKFYSFIFVGLITYIVLSNGDLATLNSLLIFLGALLAIRSYDKITYQKNNEHEV